MIKSAEKRTTVRLEGLFRTVKRAYGYRVRVNKRKRDGTETVRIPHIPHHIVDEGSMKIEKNKEGHEKITIFFENELQPLYRITEYRSCEEGKSRTWVVAKFAKNVSPDEWEKYPYYGRHVINDIS